MDNVKNDEMFNSALNEYSFQEGNSNYSKDDYVNDLVNNILTKEKIELNNEETEDLINKFQSAEWETLKENYSEALEQKLTSKDTPPEELTKIKEYIKKDLIIKENEKKISNSEKLSEELENNIEEKKEDYSKLKKLFARVKQKELEYENAKDPEVKEELGNELKTLRGELLNSRDTLVNKSSNKNKVEKVVEQKEAVVEQKEIIKDIKELSKELQSKKEKIKDVGESLNSPIVKKKKALMDSFLV